jgi:GNAT superfamily N-acetyltransferase
MSLAIRPARPSDAGVIFTLVCELAAYEKLTHEVTASEDMIAAALFGPHPTVFCEIAEWEGAPAGFALWYVNYSTFSGRHDIYLEDLFVRETFRRRGIGRALLAHLAARCVREGFARLQWAVLDWNAPSIAFYQGLGAVMQPEWKLCRLSGAALAGLAKSGA